MTFNIHYDHLNQRCELQIGEREFSGTVHPRNIIKLLCFLVNTTRGAVELDEPLPDDYTPFNTKLRSAAPPLPLHLKSPAGRLLTTLTPFLRGIEMEQFP